MAIGLRERKKVATKEALSQAALDLTIERGLDAVTAESIADAANVSTRTFHNYFASKEDAILFMLEKAIRGVVDAFAQRSVSEPVLDALEATLGAMVGSGGPLSRLVPMMTLMAEHPALIARHVAFYDDTATTMLAEIGRRTGTDPDTDLYPRLVYHCAASVVRAAVEVVIGPASPPRDAADVVREGFAQLRLGLPQPQHPASRN